MIRNDQAVSALTESAQVSLKMASGAFDSFFYYEDHCDPAEYQDDDRYLQAKFDFERHVKEANLKIKAGLEVLGAASLCDDFAKCLTNQQNTMFAHESAPGYEERYSVTLVDLHRYLSVLEAACEEDLHISTPDGKLRLLIRILTNTPFIIQAMDIDPTKEADVYKNIAVVLRSVFEDFVQSISIHSILKNYKPEYGISGIKTAIEYKFADSYEEVVRRIDELATDVAGYSGSADWRRFISVLYMTDAFTTQDAVDAQTKKLGFPDNWVVILVHGRGNRVKSRRIDSASQAAAPNQASVEPASSG